MTLFYISFISSYFCTCIIMCVTINMRFWLLLMLMFSVMTTVIGSHVVFHYNNLYESHEQFVHALFWFIQPDPMNHHECELTQITPFPFFPPLFSVSRTCCLPRLLAWYQIVQISVMLLVLWNMWWHFKGITSWRPGMDTSPFLPQFGRWRSILAGAGASINQKTLKTNIVRLLREFNLQ